jgi:hypothetical protein
MYDDIFPGKYSLPFRTITFGARLLKGIQVQIEPHYSLLMENSFLVALCLQFALDFCEPMVSFSGKSIE